MIKNILQVTGTVFMAMMMVIGWNNVFAQTQSASPVEQKEYQGIPYTSGGIGAEERQALTAMSRNYNLKLLFISQGRSYLSDVHVEMMDENGKKVLDAVADGPWFFANLPPGKYTVTGTMAGKKQTSRINIVKGQKQTILNFHWKE